VQIHRGIDRGEPKSYLHGGTFENRRYLLATRSMSSIKRDVKKKVLPRPESFSRSSPLNFHFSGEAWPIAHAHKFPPRMVAMPSSSRERQARLRFKVNHGSIRGSWPMAISGYPRGHNVIWVTRC
jgi:hypothetical protein